MWADTLNRLLGVSSVPEVPGVATILKEGTSARPMVPASLFGLVASDHGCRPQ